MRSSQSSSYCHCRVDGDVTVMPFVGVLTQHSLLARRSLRRFVDVVIVVVAALGAFRRVPCRLSLVAFAVVKTMIRPARAASFELTKLATRVGGAANTSPLTRLVRELLFCRPRDHRPHDRRVVAIVTSSRSSRPRDHHYSDRRYSIASPASKNRLIVVIAASTRPDHLLSSSPMRSTGGTIPFILLMFAALGSASGRSHSSPTPKNKGLLLRCGLRISHVLVPFRYKNGGCCFGCHFGFPNAFLWGKGVREIRPFLTGS